MNTHYGTRVEDVPEGRQFMFPPELDAYGENRVRKRLPDDKYIIITGTNRGAVISINDMGPLTGHLCHVKG